MVDFNDFRASFSRKTMAKRKMFSLGSRAHERGERPVNQIRRLRDCGEVICDAERR